MSFLASFGTVLRTAGLICSTNRPTEGHWKRDHISHRLCFLDQLWQASYWKQNGGGQRDKTNPHISFQASPSRFHIERSVYNNNNKKENPNFIVTAASSLRFAPPNVLKHIISIVPVGQFLVMNWWQTLWFINPRTDSEQRLHTDRKHCKKRRCWGHI